MCLAHFERFREQGDPARTLIATCRSAIVVAWQSVLHLIPYLERIHPHWRSPSGSYCFWADNRLVNLLSRLEICRIIADGLVMASRLLRQQYASV